MEVNIAQRNGIDFIDDATANLMVQLQCQDLVQMQDASKGKRRENDTSDSDVAMQMMQQELEQLKIAVSDRSMSRSLAQAVITDAEVLRDMAVKDGLAGNDRVLAQRLSRVRYPRLWFAIEEYRRGDFIVNCTATIRQQQRTESLV